LSAYFNEGRNRYFVICLSKCEGNTMSTKRMIYAIVLFFILWAIPVSSADIDKDPEGGEIATS
jgi:hypothetical protein